MLRTKTLIAFAFATAAYAVSTQAATTDAGAYGMPAATAAANRVVNVAPGLKHINVINGETVTFNIEGRPFTWTFQLYHQEGALPLSAILPGELHADGVTVYVSADPSYR